MSLVHELNCNEVTVHHHTIHLPNGLIGFNDLSELTLIEDHSLWPLVTLGTSNNEGPVFVALDSSALSQEYHPTLTDFDYAIFLTKCNDSLDRVRQDTLLFVILNPNQLDKTYVTANLACPVLIHWPTKIAHQVILSNSSEHSFRVRINLIDLDKEESPSLGTSYK